MCLICDHPETRELCRPHPRRYVVTSAGMQEPTLSMIMSLSNITAYCRPPAHDDVAPAGLDHSWTVLPALYTPSLTTGVDKPVTMNALSGCDACPHFSACKGGGDNGQRQEALRYDIVEVRSRESAHVQEVPKKNHRILKLHHKSNE